MILNYPNITIEDQFTIKTPIYCKFDNRINDKIHNFIYEPCLCFCESMHKKFKNSINQLLILRYNKLPIHIDNVYKTNYTNLEKLVFKKRENMRTLNK